MYLTDQEELPEEMLVEEEGWSEAESAEYQAGYDGSQDPGAYPADYSPEQLAQARSDLQSTLSSLNQQQLSALRDIIGWRGWRLDEPEHLAEATPRDIARYQAAFAHLRSAGQEDTPATEPARSQDDTPTTGYRTRRGNARPFGRGR